MPSRCKYTKDDFKCTKYAMYSFLDKKERVRCAEHKTSDMVNHKKDNRICRHEDHKDEDNKPRASFNFPGEKVPIYCIKHSKSGMINLNNINSKCKVCKLKQPSYGLEDGKATHCFSCKTTDMIDLVSNLCEEKNCKTNSTQGFPGQKPKRCKKHALDGMSDVKNKKCIVCIETKVSNPIQATYGVDKPTHCLKHKLDGMKDVRHDTELCDVCNETRASYGINKPTRCAKHKTKDMTDLVSNMCEKCKQTQPVFKDKNGNIFCKICKPTEAKNTKAKMCKKCGERQPVFNYKNETKGILCSNCKDDKMVDVINPRCKSCKLYIVHKKDQLCSYCTPSSTKRQKTREMTVVNFLVECKFEFIHNKSVGFVCGNYRPDIRIDCGTHLVIIEIDEDQHKDYPEDCEIARMVNITQAEGLRCIFLRYNPDIFKVKGDTKRVYTKTRLSELEKQINYHMKHIPDDAVTVYRMFYDNDTGEHVAKYDIGSKINNMYRIED